MSKTYKCKKAFCIECDVNEYFEVEQDSVWEYKKYNDKRIHLERSIKREKYVDYERIEITKDMLKEYFKKIKRGGIDGNSKDNSSS